MKKNLPVINKLLKGRKLFLGVFALTIFATDSFAQSPQQRSKVQATINAKSLDSFTRQSKQNFLLQEKSVEKYLRSNPGVKRTFEKNGSVYYLKYITPDGFPIYINTKNTASCTMIKADQLYPGGSVGSNIIGTGMVAGVWDGGQVRATHEILSGKVTMQPSQSLTNLKGNDHMTHVSGTMIGRLVAGQPTARGIAHGATTRNYDFSDDITEMAEFSGGGFLVSNHSYGNSNDNTTPLWLFGAYDQTAKEWDALLKTTPFYLPFVAVGNEQTDNGNMTKVGYDLITGSSAAKNVVTVGALNGDASMSNYSNWGPTDDGRFKPEMVAKGTGINSSLSTGDQAYSGTGDESSGTSYATPAAAAAGLLLQQYYNNLSGVYMRSSTLKGLMLHTATDLGNPGPDYKFGWGLLNAEKAGDVIKKAKSTAIPSGAVITEFATNPINNNSDELTTTVIASGTEPLKVSISWTDDDGEAQTDANGVDAVAGHLVYNFDMLVTSSVPASETRPWQPMGMANRTANAAKATDWFQTDNNNYKQVLIENPEAGAMYTIRIRKSTTSPATARPLSLIVSGTQAANPLPLVFVSIAATSAGTANNVKWQTATEDPYTSFEIQKSNNGNNFSPLATIKGRGLGSSYIFKDATPFSPTTYYRIRFSKSAGGYEYSNVVAVNKNKPNAIVIAPNPANTFIRLTNSSTALNGTTARITDLSGKVIMKFVMQSSQTIMIGHLKAGTYILQTTESSSKIVKL